MSSYYPIFLNLQSKHCLVVGGGEVAERKVKALVEQGAEVTVVSQHLTSELEGLSKQGVIQTIVRQYRPGDLKGALIAIAATDSFQVNHRIAKEGKRLGVLVNVVDDPGASDFVVPSRFCRGDITIAISTGGHSPALAKKIRTELESCIGPEYGSLAQLLSQVRAELKNSNSTLSGDAWQEALDLEKILPMLRAGRMEEAMRLLWDNLTKSNGD